MATAEKVVTCLTTTSASTDRVMSSDTAQTHSAVSSVLVTMATKEMASNVEVGIKARNDSS